MNNELYKTDIVDRIQFSWKVFKVNGSEMEKIKSTGEGEILTFDAFTFLSPNILRNILHVLRGAMRGFPARLSCATVRWSTPPPPTRVWNKVKGLKNLTFCIYIIHWGHLTPMPPLGTPLLLCQLIMGLEFAGV